MNFGITFPFRAKEVIIFELWQLALHLSSKRTAAQGHPSVSAHFPLQI
jgi:hypothetical protein